MCARSTRAILQPLRKLEGFQRVTLGPGQSKTVTFMLGRQNLGYYNNKAQFVNEPGPYDVWVGDSSRRRPARHVHDALGGSAMRSGRTLLTLRALAVCAAGVVAGSALVAPAAARSGSTRVAPAARAGRRPHGGGTTLSRHQRSVLYGIARDTWRFYAADLDPKTHLPLDNLGPGKVRGNYTSAANIGVYLWAVVAAHDLGLISRSRAEALARVNAAAR